MSIDRRNFPCGRVESAARFNRRELLARAGAGFGTLALADLLRHDGLLAAAETGKKGPDFPPRAKSIIWLYMEGGPSAVDLFDPKPELTRFDGKQPPVKIETFFGRPGPLMKSPFGFKQYGQCGAWVSDAYAKLAEHVDHIAFIKSCQADSNNHAAAMFQMNTGQIRPGFPSAGAWMTYGLGSENQNLPGFVVLPTPVGSKGGPGNWGAGFLPSAYQGTTLRPGGVPILNLDPPAGMDRERQRRLLDLAGEWNREHARQHPGESDLLARIDSYEMAFRMQFEAKEAVDLNKEPPSIRNLYGLDDPVTRAFGEKCLLARRMVERGVRFVQIYPNEEWDAHSRLKENHGKRCQESDQPIAGLLADLKSRGLLQSTLVIWGGEFGRMPVSEGNLGRDHNNKGFLVWMAGGGIKGGVSYGATDEIGFQAVENPVSVHDIHATILHLMGLDHTKLTYLHNGRQYRLTDVSGTVIEKILA
jgi:hypothetical protein